MFRTVVGNTCVGSPANKRALWVKHGFVGEGGTLSARPSPLYRDAARATSEPVCRFHSKQKRMYGSCDVHTSRIKGT